MLTRLEISLGDSLPRLSVSDRRMSTVEDATKSMVELLEGKGFDVTFEMVSGTHFSPLAPKFDRTGIDYVCARIEYFSVLNWRQD